MTGGCSALAQCLVSVRVPVQFLVLLCEFSAFVYKRQ